MKERTKSRGGGKGLLEFYQQKKGEIQKAAA